MAQRGAKPPGGQDQPVGKSPDGKPVVRFDVDTMPGAKAPPADARVPQAGEVIDGRYRLQGELGRGGMGVVLLGEDTRLKRKVAIKFLRANSTDTDVARFRREAQLLAQLSHPNVVRVFDLGERDHLPYFVMELLDGRTLADVLHETQGDGLPVDVALGFGRHLCEALDVVHRAGIIHRDIKPGNVIITPNMQAVLMDFGLARTEISARDRSVVSGTPQYLPPEDIRGQPLAGDDARRSDIYALGITLYELIASRPPFSDEDTSIVLHRQLLDPPPRLCDLRPDVPPAFEAVIMRALEKDPFARQASCQELLVELARARAQTVGRTSQQLSRITTTDLAKAAAEAVARKGTSTIVGNPVGGQAARSPFPPPIPVPGPPPVPPVAAGSPYNEPTRENITLLDESVPSIRLSDLPTDLPGDLPSTPLAALAIDPRGPTAPPGMAPLQNAVPAPFAQDPMRVAVVWNPGLPRERLVEALRGHMPFTDVEVWPSGRGGQILRPMIAFSPDCIVVDNDLIEESPYELCALLRSDPATAHTALLIASEELGAAQEQLFLRIGVDAIVRKPLYAERLAEHIRKSQVGRAAVG